MTHLAMRTFVVLVVALWLSVPPAARAADAPSLRAGAAKIDITDPAEKTRDVPLYAKALVLDDGRTKVAIITVDAVAIGQLGRIGNDYLPGVRAQLEKDLSIPPGNVLVNASHCHGLVCSDILQRTVQVVKEAFENLEPVTVGAGRGHEDRIMENRRLKLNDGRQSDVRHAYGTVPSQQVAAVGPVDPAIGLLRLDRSDGRPLAVVYNFACHPIQGVPGGGNTADLVGYASRAIEDSLGNGAVALFLQGCVGDINPIGYKDVNHPRDAEPLGSTLGLSVLKTLRSITTRDGAGLRTVNETLALPRADWAARIAALRAEQTRLVKSLKPTSLNFETFLPLCVKYRLSPEYPSSFSHAYMHDELVGRNEWKSLDAENRRNLEQYVENIYTMEELTRLGANLALLEMHQAQNVAAGSPTINVELMGLRVGEFVLVTFPGELTVRIGLNIKKNSPHPLTFVAGCTNGYIYYAPTEEQLANTGYAQEDCDCLLGPGWQAVFEAKAAEILKEL